MVMKVFVSHITEEAALGGVLKGWIESTFLGQVEVFVSEHDIGSGDQWFRRLESELTDARAMLVLCSDRSVFKPWVNFETGAGYIKGIPIIPICYSGITVDTLPAPLFFFQGLNAGDDEFGVKLIGDLAQHLGYTRSPLIRHEELRSEVRDVLAEIEKESGKDSAGELGLVDYLVMFTEKTEALGNLMAEFGESTEQMTIGFNKFSGQAEKAGNNLSSGTPQHVQRISRQFGEELSAYADKIEVLTSKYGETLPEVKLSLQQVLMHPSIDSSLLEENDKREFLSVLDNNEAAMLEWKKAVVECRGAMDALPNFQRNMRQGIRRIVEQFEKLTLHLDDTLDMIQDARARYISRVGH